jgi:hypothetical protein
VARTHNGCRAIREEEEEEEEEDEEEAYFVLSAYNFGLIGPASFDL